MAVKLEGSINRYLGLSTDDKPQSSYTDTIPVGSSFMETDTGRIYRFNGSSWTFAEPTDESALLLTAIYLELQEIRATLQLLAQA